MGKQINFYIDKTVEDEFMKQIFSQGFVLIAEDLDNKKLVTFNDLETTNSQMYILYLYKKDFGPIVTDVECEYRLDYLRSPVIEFTRTLIKREKKLIIKGRIWLESKFYDMNGEVVNKDPGLTKEYNSLVKWIKKNVPLQDISKGDFIVKEYITKSIKVIADSGFKLI